MTDEYHVHMKTLTFYCWFMRWSWDDLMSAPGYVVRSVLPELVEEYQKANASHK